MGSVLSPFLLVSIRPYRLFLSADAATPFEVGARSLGEQLNVSLDTIRRWIASRAPADSQLSWVCASRRLKELQSKCPQLSGSLGMTELAMVRRMP